MEITDIMISVSCTGKPLGKRVSGDTERSTNSWIFSANMDLMSLLFDSIESETLSLDQYIKQSSL